jgi:hypothetical protein
MSINRFNNTYKHIRYIDDGQSPLYTPAQLGPGAFASDRILIEITIIYDVPFMCGIICKYSRLLFCPLSDHFFVCQFVVSSFQYLFRRNCGLIYDVLRAIRPTAVSLWGGTYFLQDSIYNVVFHLTIGFIIRTYIHFNGLLCIMELGWKILFI